MIYYIQMEEEDRYLLSAALALAVFELHVFARKLQDSWEVRSNMMSGLDFTPVRAVRYALYVQGGILCKPLYFMAEVDPSPEDAPHLVRICELIAEIVSFARGIAEKLGCLKSYLRRFDFRHREVLLGGLLKNHQLPGGEARRQEYRNRCIDQACKSIRAFLTWLMHALERLCRQDQVEAGLDRMFIAPMRRGLVDICDRKRGLFVLKSPTGIGSKSFDVSPQRNYVWNVLRLLVGDNSESGDVELPKDFASHFRNTTSDNDGRADDLSDLIRHIHPSLLVRGRYHLAWEEKPRLHRD